MPTVERGLRLVVFCSIEIAGDRPSIAVDVRLAHQFEELARIGRQRLDVAALALGVDRVERQRGLAGAGQAGDHRQLVARDDDVHVLQIVLARAAHVDGAGHATRSYDLFSGCSRSIWQFSGALERSVNRRPVQDGSVWRAGARVPPLVKD